MGKHLFDFAGSAQGYVYHPCGEFIFQLPKLQSSVRTYSDGFKVIHQSSSTHVQVPYVVKKKLDFKSGKSLVSTQATEAFGDFRVLRHLIAIQQFPLFLCLSIKMKINLSPIMPIYFFSHYQLEHLSVLNLKSKCFEFSL